MFRARRAALDWLAGGAIGALVFAWFGHAFLNYDTFYALVWGGDLAAGRTPDYTVPVAPTPHPLAELVGIVLTPFGSSAEDLMLAIGLLALGMLVVGLFRLGQELFGVGAGLLAAAIIVTRVPILNYGIRGYVDLPTAAFVVWAAVLEVRRPRRGAPVLVLLGLAGLLRPEAWLYAFLYWLWLLIGARAADAPGADARAADAPAAPDRHSQIARWTLLAAAAPAIWLASDAAITGNALHSLSGTHELAAQLGRKTGLTSVPTVAPRRLGEILRLPELVAAVIGLVFTLRWARRRAWVPLAIGIANGIAYTAFGIARLPLLGRYLFVAASMLTIFAAAGALGWLNRPRDHPSRRTWRPVGIAALLAIVALFAVQQVDRLDLLKTDIAKRDRIQADLKQLVERPDVRARLRACEEVDVPSHRLVPLISLWADVRPTRIVTTTSPSGCVVWPANPTVAELAVLDPNEPGTSLAPYTGRVRARNHSWLTSL